MRHALNSLAETALAWLKAHIFPDWVERYQDRIENYRLPAQKHERKQLAETMGLDAARLIYALNDASTPQHLQDLGAVQILQDVWQQQFVFKDGAIRWRENKDLKPSSDRIASPYDQEARYSRKRETEWVGYKVHLTETCDDDTPNVIINIETTAATQQDIDAVETIHTNLADKNLLPSQHIVDMAYISSDILASSEHNYQLELLGPVRADVSWQAQTLDAFDISCFTIDWDSNTVVCPMDHNSRRWREGTGKFGKPNIMVAFSPDDCQNCLQRLRCTKSNKRGLTFPQETEYKALQAARERQTSEAFKLDYRKRAGIEGTISQSVNALQAR